MSALEEQEVQRLSGVKISQTARGEATVTVHVYVGAADEDQVRRERARAAA